ncbi:MAG: ribosome small subunit-dependent GTPase A [Pseudomonadales bacterium]
MAKRKLSNRQQARIAKDQRARAGDAESLETGLVIAHYGNEVEVLPINARGDIIVAPDQPAASPPASQARRCKLRANLPLVVCGDRVAWREATDSTGSAVVEALQPRESVILRPRPHSDAKPIAANIDLVLLVFSPEPAPIANLLDRYLIAAANANIPAALLLNKSDLLGAGQAGAAHSAEIASLTTLYSELGYPVYHYSALAESQPARNDRAACGAPGKGRANETPGNIVADYFDAEKVLNGKTAILVGQSGVGKSSIINALYREHVAATGDISSANVKGRHTTTNARLYFLEQSDAAEPSALIDSPGIREFALWHLSAQDIIEGMPEFFEKTLQCKFRDCEHGVSAGCALQAAIENGEIHPSRVASYRHILATREI